MTYRTGGVKITVKTSFANNIISSFRCYNQSQFTLLITHCAAVPRRPARGELRERGGDHGLFGEVMQTVAHEGNSALALRMSYPDEYKSGIMNIHNTSLRSFALECLLK